MPMTSVPAPKFMRVPAFFTGLHPILFAGIAQWCNCWAVNWRRLRRSLRRLRQHISPCQKSPQCFQCVQGGCESASVLDYAVLDRPINEGACWIGGESSLGLIGCIDFGFHLLPNVVKQIRIAVVAQPLRKPHHSRCVYAYRCELCCRHERDFVIVAHDIIGNFPIAAAKMVVIFAEPLYMVSPVLFSCTVCVSEQ